MHKISKIILSLCMVLSMVIGNFPFAEVASAKQVKTNIAPQATFSVDSNDEGKGALNDEDRTNDWQFKQAFKDIVNKTITIRAKLETGSNVNEVKVYLGSSDWQDTQVDVEVTYAQNGITSDMLKFGNKQTATLGSVVTISQEQAVSATDIYVTISNPRFLPGATHTDFTLWPSVKEVEIYAMQEVKLSNYNNIASQATITTDGQESHTDGKANLVDNNPNTLYKFHDAKLTEEKYILLTFDDIRNMDACTMMFEHVDQEPYAYQFVFSIKGVKEDGTEVLLVDHQTGNRTDKFELDYKFTEGAYKAIKIIMHETKNNVGDGIGWPAIAEFRVFGSEVEVRDDESIAFQKPVHTNMNRLVSGNIVDGSTKSLWSANLYPSYADIDLEANYYLDEVQVFTPAQGYSQYTIYTSMNGRDFTKLAEKTGTESCGEKGESYPAKGVEARYVRVYVTYNSESANTVLNEVRVLGQPSNTELQPLPAIDVKPFNETEYANVVYSDDETVKEVQGIVERRLGKDYINWFTFEVAAPAANGYDYFELSSQNGKVHIKGNDGVSLATGLNYYLKYECNVNISQVGDQVTMPKEIKLPAQSVRKETKAKVRYAYNYCTLSYSMPFYGQDEWRAELDWLALNGVNVVLDATAQEEVWRRFLGKLDYTHADSKDFIAGPAYYAWAYMANLSGFGGPIHDSWFKERTELARKNHVSMRKLGMEPVLQGYSGMIPNDLAEHDASAAKDIIKQGKWCDFQRPDMLKTDTATYQRYAKLFYESQQEVYGDGVYFATDPFHEGGNTGGMSPRVIAKEVVETMMKHNGNDAVWIIQSWQGNPSSELLAGLEGHRENALVLDLYAEKTPHYNEYGGGSYGYKAEFDGTPWTFCMLNNFGGRLGLHGHLDNLANNIPEVFNTKQHIAGIGITPEASVNNPLLYDYFFEIIWQDDANNMKVVELDPWLEDYATRRYGAVSKSSQDALKILKDTVYKASLNNRGQGAPESVVNARPQFDIGAASTWGNSVIGYDKGLLEEAARLLLEDYNTLKGSEGYRYDVATVLEQVLSNTAQNQLRVMKKSFESRDVDKFREESSKFLAIIDNMEKVTSTSKYYMLGNWVNQAKRLAMNADDFAKDIYELNAKALITTWGAFNQANTGGLHDYSNRQWSGLLNDFYKARWQIFIDNRIKELQGQSAQDPNWFAWEWTWARGKDEYSDTPVNRDLHAIGNDILTNFSSFNPATKADHDLPLEGITVTTGSYQPGNATEGDPNYVLDNNPDTLWHTAWSGSPRDQHYLEFTLPQNTVVSAIRYLPRGGNNGSIKSYRVLVRENVSDEWTVAIADGKLDYTNAEWQVLPFDGNKEYNAKQIRFEVTDAYSTNSTLFAAAREIRFMESKLAKLNATLEQANSVQANEYTKDTYDVFKAVLDTAKTMTNNNTQVEVDTINKDLQTAMSALVKRGNTAALQSVVEANSNLVRDDYAVSDEQWIAFTQALDAAKAYVQDNSNATQADVDDAKATLEAQVAFLQANRSDLALTTYSLSMAGNISMNFYFEVKDRAFEDQSATITLTKENKDPETFLLKDLPVREYKGKQLYHVSAHMTAREMKDFVAVSANVNGKSYDFGSYCVQDYAKELLAGNYSDQAKEAVRTMLNYGASAQTYFNYKPTTLANDILDESQKVVNVDPSVFNQYQTVKSGALTNLTYKGTTLVLESETKMSHYFTLEAGASITDYTFKVDNKVVSANKKAGEENLYYVDVTNIVAKDLNRAYTLTVTKGEETQTITCCALAYGKVVYEQDKPENLKRVMNAIYAYHQAAVAYAESVK